MPKVYPRVTLASASILLGSVVRALRGGEGLPKSGSRLQPLRGDPDNPPPEGTNAIAQAPLLFEHSAKSLNAQEELMATSP